MSRLEHSLHAVLTRGTRSPAVACGQCGGTGHLNAPTSDTFKAHFFEHGTYLGRFAGQDYFRSDGSPWGVGPKDGATKKSFNAKDWQ